MAQSGFECIQAFPLLSKEGLPNVSHLSLLPSPIEGSLDVAVACFDGALLLAHFDGSAPSRVDSLSAPNQPKHTRYGCIYVLSLINYAIPCIGD
jgi:hypothetical protein